KDRQLSGDPRPVEHEQHVEAIERGTERMQGRAVLECAADRAIDEHEIGRRLEPVRNGIALAGRYLIVGRALALVVGAHPRVDSRSHSDSSASFASSASIAPARIRATLSSKVASAWAAAASRAGSRARGTKAPARHALRVALFRSHP